MDKIHIWKEEPQEIDGEITISARIESPNGTSNHLWYRVKQEYISAITHKCDPFVVAIIFQAMRQATDIVIHGEVSPSLLQNLTEFQAIWNCWCPTLYKPIEISAEIEQEGCKKDDKTIAAFSGGVDSCFTIFRHSTGRCGRLKRNLQAALMVHGFDIPLAQKQVFENAALKSREMLNSLGVELIEIATNFREFKQDWEDAHGAGLASCLMMLQGGYSGGLIGSSDPYHALNLPYGSNPISDRYLSSSTFEIIHDGASFTRISKIANIANWPEALQYLRVCWQGEQLDRNCGRCEKCIRTILGFRVMGVALPPCFEQDITDEQILGIKAIKKSQLIELLPILQAAKNAHINDSWVKALSKSIYRNQLLAGLESSKQALKKQLPPTLYNRIQQMRSLLRTKN